MIDEKILKNEEKAIFSLRSLYKKYGYLPYKMSKFEEYELYIRNKDFLVSDRIITFNDTNGKLMALKPDVTLSIIKNGEDVSGYKQKVYYNENVYRVSESTKHYKEIMQTGLECIGEIDLYDVFETITLAVRSLEIIGEKFVLEISHLGILSAVMSEISNNEIFSKKAIDFISQKNAHDLKRLCEEYEVEDADYEKLAVFVKSYGERKQVLEELKDVCSGAAKQSYDEFCEISKMIDECEYSDNIIFDFSVVNDMNYYNSIAFKGFIDGICDGVIAGGRYDKLMRKMGRKSGAVGFAVYTDLLEQLQNKKSEYDVDVVLIYNEKDDKIKLKNEVEKYIENGKTVSVQKSVTSNLRGREIVYFGKENKDA